MSSLLSELRRRNVFKVGAAYLVLGWVVMQVTGLVAPALHLPEWTLSLVTWLGVIGFPFALLLAWAFELTPDGLKRSEEVDPAESVTRHTGNKLNRMIAALLVAAVGFVIYQQWAFTRSGASQSAPAGKAQSLSGLHESIAVLPFVNMSSDPEQEYLSDGIAEELLNALARISNLKVAARTSSFAFKDEQSDIRKIGETLGVSTVLEGSLRKSGTRLRITAQLIDVQTGYHLWSETYDRELDDVFAIQDEITGNIVKALKVHLDTGEAAAVTNTNSTEAYDAYLKGRHQLHQRTRDSIELAENYFEQATALDPDFALAWSDKALAAVLLIGYGDSDTLQAHARARTLLSRAQAIDSTLAEALAVEGLMLLNELRFELALGFFDRAIAAKPSVGEFHLWRSHALMGEARIREAQQSLLTALPLDPLHPAILFNISSQVCVFGLDVSAEEVQRILAMDPKQQSQTETVCLFYEGKLADFYRLVESTPGPLTSGFLWAIRSILGDCEAEWPITKQVEVDRFIRSAFCSDVAQAEALYASLPEAHRNQVYALETYAQLRLIQGDYQGYLDYLDRAYPDSPVFFTIDTPVTNLTSLFLLKAFAHEKLGQVEESRQILETIRMYLDRAKHEGLKRGYRFLEGSLMLMEGDVDGGYELMAQGIADHELTYGYERDPMLRDKLGPERLAKLLAPLHENINAEREKLGWPAIEF